MPQNHIAELKALLAERFPGLRTRLAEPRTAKGKVQSTGLTQIDAPLRGGFPQSALSEVIVPGPNGGCSTLIRALLEQTARAHQIAALIDGNDSFDAAAVAETALARLFWIRCQSAAAAVRSTDLVLRDSNLPLVLLDLKACAECQLQRISAATWYRFQRLAEETGAACLVFTPRRLVPPAKARVILRSRFRLAALDQNRDELLRGLAMEVSEAGKYVDSEFVQFKA